MMAHANYAGTTLIQRNHDGIPLNQSMSTRMHPSDPEHANHDGTSSNPEHAIHDGTLLIHGIPTMMVHLWSRACQPWGWGTPLIQGMPIMMANLWSRTCQPWGWGTPQRNITPVIQITPTMIAHLWSRICKPWWHTFHTENANQDGIPLIRSMPSNKTTSNPEPSNHDGTLLIQNMLTMIAHLWSRACQP